MQTTQINLKEIERDALSLAHNFFLPFCEIMWRGFEINWHLSVLAQKLEAVERGEIKRLMVFMPPRHGKSLMCSELFPAWYLGRNPHKQLITSSYGYSLSAEFGRKARNHMIDYRYSKIFPNVKLSEDSKAKDRFTTNQGGAFLATGVGGAMTGYGADLLLIDDPVKDRQDASSETIQQSTWGWYKSTAHTRLQPNGAIIVIQTRWNEKDLAGMILEAERDKWEIVCFPAIAEQDEEFRKAGEALWGDRYSVEDLLDIKSLDPDEFQCLFQQNPFAVESQEFKRTWFKYFRDDECPANLRIFTTVDPAISELDSADYSAVMTVGVAPDDSKYILEYTNERMNPSELIEEIFRHANKFESDVIGIESIAYQKSIKHYMEKEMLKRKEPFNVVEIKQIRMEKAMKIRGLIPYYKTGQIYHRQLMSELLESQLLRFPRGAHDDVIDALAMQIELWRAPKHKIIDRFRQTGKTVKQIMKEEGVPIH